MTEDQINEQHAALEAEDTAEAAIEPAAVELPEIGEVITIEASSTGGYLVLTMDTATNLSTFISVVPDMETAVDAAQGYELRDGEAIFIVPAVYSRMG